MVYGEKVSRTGEEVKIKNVADYALVFLCPLIYCPRTTGAVLPPAVIEKKLISHSYVRYFEVMTMKYERG